MDMGEGQADVPPRRETRVRLAAKEPPKPVKVIDQVNASTPPDKDPAFTAVWMLKTPEDRSAFYRQYAEQLGDSYPKNDARYDAIRAKRRDTAAGNLLMICGYQGTPEQSQRIMAEWHDVMLAADVVDKPEVSKFSAEDLAEKRAAMVAAGVLKERPVLKATPLPK